VETKLKSEVFSILDRTEDLMYRMLATITDLQSRGHRVLMFQQADNLYLSHLDNPRLKLFQRPEIINGFKCINVYKFSICYTLTHFTFILLLF
jgi:hypothetical protein